MYVSLLSTLILYINRRQKKEDPKVFLNDD